MRKSWIAGGAFALGLVGLALAADETNKERYEIKGPAGSCEGAIVRLFKDEKLVEFKVEKILARTERDASATPKDDERGAAEKAKDKVEGDVLKEGQVVFLHVESARIFDENGKELKREDKGSWFSRDAGWSALKEGMRLKVEHGGTHMMPAPKGFPRDARAGGNILVYHVDSIHILPTK